MLISIDIDHNWMIRFYLNSIPSVMATIRRVEAEAQIVYQRCGGVWANLVDPATERPDFIDETEAKIDFCPLRRFNNRLGPKDDIKHEMLLIDRSSVITQSTPCHRQHHQVMVARSAESN